MKINFILIILLSLSSCKSKVSEEFDYTKQARKITGRFCEEISLPKDLYLTGYGGALMHDVKELALHFDAFECLNLEEARKLYVEMTETYLDYINEDEAIRPFLHNYPFTIKNLKIMITFFDHSGNYQDNGCIALIFRVLKTSQVFYCAYDSEKKDFVDVHEEPYEEAKRIVLESSETSSESTTLNK